MSAPVRRRRALRRAARLAPVVLLGVAATSCAAGVRFPIPAGPSATPAIVGAAATPQPIPGIAAVPQNPFMAANGNSSIHNDGWQSDTYERSGPLGIAPRTSSAFLGGVCGSIAYDSRGRIVTTCIGLTRTLYLLDPAKLDVIDAYRLPAPAPSAGMLTGFGGGGYFYLDAHDQAVIGTSDQHIVVVGESADGRRLEERRSYDLSGVLSDDEGLNSALPSSDGRLWFVGKNNGVVGTLNLLTGEARVIRLGDGASGEIENSFAVGDDGEAYIATNRELVRAEAGPGGTPRIVWSQTYDNTGIQKPGQVDDGTGTTPTVLPGGYVAIADNADPMQVVVYRTAPDATHRVVCEVPVFEQGGGSTENSLIGAGTSLIVENNYGYEGPQSVSLGKLTRPGITRIDIDDDGQGCHVVWANTTTAIPTVVPKLSLGNGLIYAYVKGSQLTSPWYWAALDFRTGREVWRIKAGSGPLFNNNYAGISIGPDGTARLGVLGGMVTLADGAR